MENEKLYEIDTCLEYARVMNVSRRAEKEDIEYVKEVILGEHGVVNFIRNHTDIDTIENDEPICGVGTYCINKVSVFTCLYRICRKIGLSAKYAPGPSHLFDYGNFYFYIGSRTLLKEKIKSDMSDIEKEFEELMEEISINGSWLGPYTKCYPTYVRLDNRRVLCYTYGRNRKEI